MANFQWQAFLTRRVTKLQEWEYAVLSFDTSDRPNCQLRKLIPGTTNMYDRFEEGLPEAFAKLVSQEWEIIQAIEGQLPLFVITEDAKYFSVDPNN